MNETWRSPAEINALHFRAAVLRHIREFFFTRKVIEVETPVLSQAGNTDPNIESFQLDYEGPFAGGNPCRWLRTSPEFPLKRLLAGGIGDCYELGKVFRNGEFGGRHNPEFSMLEWYRVGWNHRQLMTECVELVSGLFALRNRELDVLYCSYRALFVTGAGIDPFADSNQQIADAVRSRISMDLSGLSRDDLLDLLLTHVLEPAMPANRLTVLYDFPASQCALARIRDDEYPVAERFELYVGSIEMANGYHELNDAQEQALRFQSDLMRRAGKGLRQPAVDRRLLSSLSSLPDCSGVAMGIDRLLMALLDVQSIAEVVSFDFSRA